MNIIKISLSLICLLLLNGCASTTTQSPTTATQPIDIEYSNSYPSATLNDFIVALFDVLRNQDEESYVAMWDANEFAERSVGLMDISAVNANLVRQTLIKKDIFARLSLTSLATFRDAQLSLLDSDMLQIKIRITKENHSLYAAIVVSPRGDTYKIVDVLDYGLGVYQSQKSAIIFTTALSASEEDKVALQTFSNAMQVLRNNDPYSAIKQLETIPEPLLSKKTYLTAYLTAASVDEIQIKKALQLLEKHYADDPSVSYLMAQLYLMREQNTQAIKALKTFADIIETDPDVNIIIAQLYLQDDDIDNAILYANKALRIEPRSDLAYWMLAKILSRKNQPNDALLALKVLKNYFGYEFKGEHFKSEKAFASLYQYEKFNTWVKQFPQ